MPVTSIVFGILLTLIGAIGYIHGTITEHASVTALIPAFFGIVLFILGVIARSRESLRKHLMHVAVVVALIGFMMPMVRLLMKIGDLTMSAAVVSQLAMAFVCLLFVTLAVKSFADARRASGSS
jgi:hypothetical protein